MCKKLRRDCRSLDEQEDIESATIRIKDKET
jgi:hypothetical protein